MPSRFVLSTAILTVLSLLVLFQNCDGGPVAAGPTNVSSEVGPGVPDGPVSGGANFRKGEAFNYDYLPNKSQMLDVMMASYGYSGFNGSKAIAVTANGLGFVTRKSSGSQEDASTAALEACFAISGGQSCALVATGDVFNVSLSNLASSYTFRMTAKTTFAADAIPFVSVGQRAQLVNDYGVAPSPKALAVSVDGAYAWASNSATLPLSDLAEARRLALERCEMMAAVTPCTLVAENQNLVFNPMAINRTPQIDYYKATLADAIPGMRTAVFNVQMNQDYIPRVDRREKGVVYITADGRGGYAISNSEATAETDARAACLANQGSQPCFRYAINRVIQPLTDHLAAIRNYSLDLHCRTVPRQNCEAHMMMGCPAGGNFYVMSGSQVTMQVCQ